ncbi:MAG: M1 family aminopeptidase [Bacteroidota bacterium]
MIGNIIRFELKYRAKRPDTYIYSAVMLLLCFLAIYVENVSIGGASGQLKDDASFIVTFQMLIMSVLSMFFGSAVMGVPVLRDYDHMTYSMMFTAPIKKHEYIIGRFLGSLIILLIILACIPLGLLLGRIFSVALPWPGSDTGRFLDQLHLEFYWRGFWIFLLPNALFSGAIFFMGGTLSKKLLFVFVQGVGLLTLYLMAGQLLQNIDNRELASLLDPFGLATFRLETQYWSLAQQNYQPVAFAGNIMWNRILWSSIGLLFLGLTYFFFKVSPPSSNSRKKKKKLEASNDSLPMPGKLALTFSGFQVQFQRLLALTRLYYREIVRATPFLGITILGFIYMMVASININEVFGNATYPTTYLILEFLEGFDLFFFIIVVFYSGELIWRERDIRMNQIYDTLPVPDALGLVSKFLAFVFVHITLLLGLMLMGMLIQTMNGYTNYEIGIYLTTLFTTRLSWLVLFTLLAFFLQVMINHKFLAHGMLILFFITLGILGNIGLEHSLFQFGSGRLESYSDMNVFDDSFLGWSWFKGYWFAFCMILFGIAVAFSVRGTDTILKTRAKLASMRFVRPLLIFSLSAMVLFVSSGFYIYYNTNVINEYRTSDAQEDIQEKYERELKQFEYLNQPKIVETNVKVDLFPKDRDYKVNGYYILKNRSQEPIKDIHVQIGGAQADMTYEDLEFVMLDSIGGTDFKVKNFYEDFDYGIFTLPRALQPGDSVKMIFRGHYDTKGFKVEGDRNNQIVRNGTFFNNSNFPILGYQSNFELFSDDERKKRGLPEKERSLEKNDPRGLTEGQLSNRTRFEIIMSTTPDQIAIAPGYLQRKWTENGRSYYHYKMDAPIFNFYSMISARYTIKEDFWVNPVGDTVKLEIYYHKGHEYNLDRMMQGMRNSLEYFSDKFSLYQYRQMRIMEFPRYSSFAQSFANTVPFSEGIGFILDADESEVDVSYYVTSHEMAHQWWGHQVCPANVKGGSMIVESLAQYSALMLMKQEYSTEEMQKFLKLELDRYLSGRRNERKKEQAIVDVENQQYIHYGKGSLLFYALQDYISEDSVNLALRRFVNDWAYREDTFPNTDHFMSYIYEVTPDTMVSFVKDMFEDITFYENKTLEATAKQEGENYQVNMTFLSEKSKADSLGTESPVILNDWIYVGVYGENASGEDSLMYYQRHLFQNDTTELSLAVGAKPTRVGIDPINILIDKHPNDNRKKVELE